MENEKSFLGEFTFDNPSVTVKLETIVNESTGEEVTQLAIKNNVKEKIRMGYTNGIGLKVINTKQRKNNPLGEFLGIKKDDLTHVKSYIDKYGFLYPLENNRYEKFVIKDFFELQDRLLAFIQLVNNQSDINRSVKELLDAVLFLIFKQPENIKNENILPYLKNEIKLDALLSTPLILSEKHNTFNYEENSEGQVVGYFTRHSISLNVDIKIPSERIDEIIQDYNIPEWYKSIFKLFFSLDNIEEIDAHHKYLVEFLFGLLYSLGPFPIDNLPLHGIFIEEYYNELKENETLVNSLINVSKILIIKEFETALQFVKPTYDIEKMRPDWKLPSLISALYFSIYYRNSKNALFRKCENINCNQYFEVSNTNSTKRHCSDGCRENKNARNLRARARKKQGL